MTPENYKVALSKNKWKSLKEHYFAHSTNGELSSKKTLVKLKYDDEYLYVKFECQQNPFWSQNTYTTHNAPLYNQEVFEIFIAAGTDTPDRYLELEINPNNAIWVGKVHNPTKGQGGGNTLEMIPYDKAGIKHNVEKKGDTWSGYMNIPWKLIGVEKSEFYRINFYRIVATTSHENPNWQCDTQTCDFLCWSPTMSGTAPAFHRPAYFGSMQLK